MLIEYGAIFKYDMRIIAALVILVLLATDLKAQIKMEILQFTFEGDILNGVFNAPDSGEPKGVVLIVHK